MQGKPLESVSVLKSARQPNAAIALVVETSPLGVDQRVRRFEARPTSAGSVHRRDESGAKQSRGAWGERGRNGAMRPERGRRGRGADWGNIVEWRRGPLFRPIIPPVLARKRPCSALGNCGAGVALEAMQGAHGFRISPESLWHGSAQFASILKSARQPSWAIAFWVETASLGSAMLNRPGSPWSIARNAA